MLTFLEISASALAIPLAISLVLVLVGLLGGAGDPWIEGWGEPILRLGGALFIATVVLGVLVGLVAVCWNLARVVGNAMGGGA